MAMVKYQCTYCGTTSIQNQGNRPLPGNCSRKPKTKDGKYKPHSWVKVK
jgi:hypothetical protein